MSLHKEVLDQYYSYYDTNMAQLIAAEGLRLLRKELPCWEHPRCISQYDLQREWRSLVNLDSWLSRSWLKALYCVCQIDAKRVVISVTWHFGD